MNRAEPEARSATAGGTYLLAQLRALWNTVERPSSMAFLTWLLLVGILILSSLLRLYRLPDLMTYLGDEGWLLTLIRQMLETHQPMLVGGGSGVAPFLRGPAYYYLLLPAYLIGGGSPLSTTAFVALLDVFAAFILFLIGRRLFNQWVGLVAAAFYACSSWAVYFARITWTPSPLPFFTLVIIWSLCEIVRGKQNYLMVLVPAWAIAWQIYDPPLLLLPLFFMVWLWFRPRIRVRIYAAAFLLALLVLAPFLLYEAQHNLVDLRIMAGLIVGGGERAQNPNLGGTKLSNMGLLLQYLNALLPPIGAATILLSCAALLGLVRLGRGVWRNPRQSFLVLLLYSLLPLLYVFYPAPLDVRFLTMIFPLPPLLIAIGLDAVRGRHVGLDLVMGLLVALIVGQASVSQVASFYGAASHPGTYLAVQSVVDRIIADANGRPFDFRLISSYAGFGFFETPYTHLFAIRNKRPVDRGDVDTFVVYDPQTQADGPSEPGVVINGVKVTHLGPPQAAGPNLIANRGVKQGDKPPFKGWVFSILEGGHINESSSGETLTLVGETTGDGLNAIQDFPVRPEQLYLARFGYRYSLREGDVRVYLTVNDQKGNGVGTFPSGGGYLLPESTDWTVGSFLVQMPDKAARAAIWLRNRGVGEAQFTNVEVYPVSVPIMQ